MKIHDVQQGSLPWMLLRAGIPTASEFDQLLTPEFKIRTGQMPRSYLAKKIAEWWQGGPLMGFNNFDVDQGTILENEAIPWFQLQYDQPVTKVGFITTDDGLVGCSPDGLLGEHSGVEIKCPKVETHVGYLLDGTLPKDYAPQVHGSMFVTGRPTWHFLSYRRHFPPLLVIVERDNDIQESIKQALEVFLENFDRAKKRLEQINGGPPVRTEKREPLPVEDVYDVIP